MNFSFDFSGKNVFVFGGTSGINLGIAEAFVAAGARIGVASRSQDKVDAAVARLSRPDAPALASAWMCANLKPWPMRSRPSCRAKARSMCWCRARRATFLRPLRT